MAKKRAKSKRRPRKSSKRPDLALQLLKIFVSLTILSLLVVSAGMLAHFFIRRPASDVPQVVRIPVRPAQAATKPKYEVFPNKELPAKPITKLPQIPGDRPPVVAIVVDDIGYDREVTALLLTLDAPLTFSVLPYGPFSRQLSAEARAKGHEIMLHLPMEPNEFPAVNPGPGALLTQMTPDEMLAQLTADLEQIPGLKGVNNHMGSGLSTSPERMRQIFTVLKKRGLYYIDSRTTADTVARPSAQKLQIPFAERDIFIDHFEDEKFIRDQLKRLIKRAQRQGYAVGIAHPHTITYQVLADFLPQLKEKVELVPASMVIQTVMDANETERQAAR